MLYLVLFFSAFIAATLLPAFSELGLAGLIVAGKVAPLPAWFWASLGNILGALVNWLLGRYLQQFRGQRWFPISATNLDRGSRWFQRYGTPSLLFAWLPVVGDPLTFAAGALGVRFWPFLILVAIGKAVRYGVVVLLALGVV